MSFSLYHWRCGSKVKAFACNVGDLSLIPGSGRSPGEGNGNPLQYCCLENPMDGGAWWATVHRVAKSRTRLSTLACTHMHSGFSPNLFYDFPIVSKHYWNLVKIIRGLGFRESFSVVHLGWSKTSILLGFLEITETLTRCLLSPNTETAAWLSWIRMERAFSSSH